MISYCNVFAHVKFESFILWVHAASDSSKGEKFSQDCKELEVLGGDSKTAKPAGDLQFSKCSSSATIGNQFSGLHLVIFSPYQNVPIRSSSVEDLRLDIGPVVGI